MSPQEMELLLLCARSEITDQQGEQLRELVAQVSDWPRLMSVSDRHGFNPLLFRHVDAWAADLMPKRTYGQLWASHEANRSHAGALSSDLVRVIAALEARAVPVIPFKGPTLAAALFGDTAAREYVDLDVLVPKHLMNHAEEALVDIGYRPAYSLTPQVRRAYMASDAQYHWVLVNVETGTTLEVHWRTDAHFPVERMEDEKWRRALSTQQFGGKTAQTFRADDLIIVLAVHASKHLWSRIAWLVDIAELLRQHPNLEWAAIWARCAELRCSRRLAVTLVLIRELLDAELPVGALPSNQPDEDGLKIVSGLLPSILQEQTASSGSWRRLRTELQLYETSAQRWHHSLEIIVVPTLAEWERWPLPTALHFLYVPLRLWRHIVNALAGSKPA